MARLEEELSELNQEISVIQTQRDNRERLRPTGTSTETSTENEVQRREREASRQRRAEEITTELVGESDTVGRSVFAHTLTLNAAMMLRLKKKEGVEKEMRKVQADIARIQQERKGVVDELQDPRPLFNEHVVGRDREGGDRERMRVIRLLNREIRQLKKRLDELKVERRRIQYEESDEDSVHEEKDAKEEEEEEKDDDAQVTF